MTYDDIVADCLKLLPGAVKYAIREALFAAVRDLCNEANVLRHTQSFTLAQADDTFLLTADAGHTPLRVVSVEAPKWSANLHYSQTSPTTMTVYKARIGDTVVDYTVAVVPDDATLELDPELARYRDAIYHRALFYMMKTPNKQYSNAGIAAYHEGEWMAYLADAKRHALFGQHRSNRIARIRKFV